LPTSAREENTWAPELKGDDSASPVVKVSVGVP
jgi:hypothetical protein